MRRAAAADDEERERVDRERPARADRRDERGGDRRPEQPARRCWAIDCAGLRLLELVVGTVCGTRPVDAGRKNAWAAP